MKFSIVFLDSCKFLKKIRNNKQSNFRLYGYPERHNFLKIRIILNREHVNKD